MKTFASLLRRRPHFRRLWLSEVVSLAGDWMSFVAVSLLALREGSGVVSLALVLVGHSLPHALLAPVAGALADRLDRRRLMIGANVVQGSLTTMMAAAAALGSVTAVQVLLFARASVGAFLPPVQSAAMRHVVDDDELLTANTVSSLSWSVMFAVGMAVGGVIAVLGPTVALLVDASSFGVAALLQLGLPAMSAEERPAEGSVLTALAAVKRDMGAAIRYAWARTDVLAAVLAKTPIALAGGGAWVLLNLTANDVAFAGSAAITLGVLQCIRGIGTGVGPVLIDALVRRGMPNARAWKLAALMAFGGIAALAAGGPSAALILATLTWGAGVGSNWVLSSAAIQRLPPDRFLGRLAALDGLLHTTALCLVALGGATLVDRIGVHAASAWLSLAVGVAAWAAVQLLLRRRNRDAPRDDAIAIASPRP